ncbi:MBL fold metallo-hydrolase [Pseudoroseomonas cervicalis]|uniref:MBL fold metallo-hydrolase n=1 Tax=Teichococcus cervicalis TaxID=204525 RepID=UPI0035E8AC4E
MSDSDAPRLRQPALTPVRGAQKRGRVFLNPDGSLPGHRLGAVWRMLREGGGTPWPDWIENPVYPPPPEAPPGQAVVTFLGHASFLIRLPGGPTLLTDPIWSDRCSPLRFAGPKRVRAPGMGFDALPPIDAVLLSHNHYDHCDIPTLKRLQRRFAPRIITGLGNAKLLAKHGMEDVLELDWWQPAPLPGGAWAHYVPARHATARGAARPRADAVGRLRAPGARGRADLLRRRHRLGRAFPRDRPPARAVRPRLAADRRL